MEKRRGTEPAGPMVIHTSNTKPVSISTSSSGSCSIQTLASYLAHLLRLDYMYSDIVPALEVRHRCDVRCIGIFGTTVRCACDGYTPCKMRIKGSAYVTVIYNTQARGSVGHPF